MHGPWPKHSSVCDCSNSMRMCQRQSPAKRNPPHKPQCLQRKTVTRGYSPKGRSMDCGIAYVSAMAIRPTAPNKMNGACWSHGAGFGVSIDMSPPPMSGPAARAIAAHDCTHVGSGSSEVCDGYLEQTKPTPYPTEPTTSERMGPREALRLPQARGCSSRVSACARG